jgi:hypothetical protein
MAKYIDTFYRLGTNAFARDRHNNEITGEALMLALLLHTKRGPRTKENEESVSVFLDDPNIDKPKRK